MRVEREFAHRSGALRSRYASICESSDFWCGVAKLGRM